MIPANPPESAPDCAADFGQSDCKPPCESPDQVSPDHQPPASTYFNRLYPWLIIRQLPQMQRVNVARFRQRSEAEAHLTALRRLTPDASYLILFDPP
jgi:hypothetical protein